MGNITTLMLLTALLHETVVTRPSIHFMCILFWKLKAEELMMASGDRRCRNQGVPPHLPALVGTSCPALAFPLLFLEPFCPTERPGKPSPQTTVPPSLPQAALSAATAALARTQLEGNKEQKKEGQPETASCHGSSWKKGGRNARKCLVNMWGCSRVLHDRGALCHVVAWVGMG